jgi:hypothetical protein
MLQKVFAVQAVIKVGTYKECSAISKRIESLTRLPHTTILKSNVVHSYVIAHERFVGRLFSRSMKRDYVVNDTLWY